MQIQTRPATCTAQPTPASPQRKDKPIASAEQAAFIRALAHRDGNPGVRNPDHLAHNFVRDKQLANGLKMPRLTRLVLSRQFPGYYYYHITRTKFVDEILLNAASNGLEQLVILGAGYDSRPYRFREQLGRAKVLELDYPATQAVKKQRLTEMFGSIPADVTFVPIDFNSESIAERLAEGGYDRSLRTLFLWEGVVMYLEAKAVESVLRFIATQSAPGSGLVFDYCLKSVVGGDLSAYGARASAKFVAKNGEPYIFGLEPAAVPEFLRKHGFCLVRDLGSDELERTYLGGRGPLGGRRVWGFNRMLHAVVA